MRNNFKYKNHWLFIILIGLTSLSFSFRVEAGLVKSPVVADVSSENVLGLDRHANHTVDGSGLTGDGSAGSTHQEGENGIAWTTAGTYDATDYDPYIVYDLGQVCNVTRMRIWNYNSAYQIGSPPVNIAIIGPDEVDVYTSVNGINFTFAETVHFTEASASDDYKGQDIAVDYQDVRYIKFDIMTNHDGAVFDGTGTQKGLLDKRSLTGLSEVRFEVPEMVAVSESDGTAVAYENGATDNYDIVLTQSPAPGTTVEITAVPSEPLLMLDDALAGESVTLIFTVQDWNLPQTITVTAVQSTAVTSSKKKIAINHTAGSTDAVFDGVLISPVSVTYVDETCGLWGYNRMDFNRDCRVGLVDFAAFALQWLECTKPGEPGCVDLLPADSLPANSDFINKLIDGENQKIVTLGTSLTADVESDPETGTQWVAQIRNWLESEFPGQVIVLNYGRAGSASSEPSGTGRSGLDMVPVVMALEPNVVFIEYTINDAYVPYNISLQNCEDNFNSIINDIYSYNPDTEIIIQIMNSIKGSAAADRPQFEQYNQVYRDVARQRRLPLIDHYGNWLNLMTNDPVAFDIYVPDGVHPTANGQSNIMIPTMKSVLWPGWVSEPVDIVAHWPMDEGGGTTLGDVTGHGYNGSITTGVTWGSGITGACLVFNGTQGDVNCGDIDLTGSVSISVWLKPSPTGLYQRAVSKGSFSNGWQIGISNTNKAEFALKEDLGVTRAIYGATTFQANTWYHVVGVYDIDADRMLLYVNGQLEADQATISSGSGGIMLNNNPFMIGRAYPEGGSFRWKGSVDELSYWNGALSTEDVKKLYQDSVSVKVKINESDNTTVVYEGGSGDSYDIVLTQQPTADATVQIKAVPSDEQIRLNDAVAGIAVDISFTDQDWDTPKTITVSAINDTLTDPNHISSIHHIVSSATDPYYDGTVVTDIPVTIVDNDTCGNWGYSEMDFDENCHVDIKDMSIFAAQWLDTTAPNITDSVNRHMDWWREARYYWFISWNPSSIAGTEISWSRNAEVPKEDYDLLYTQFNPTEFDANEWVSIAKAAGFKTIVLITKHHDGFCMWDTQYTNYNIMNSPFGRDVVRELADACKRQNFPLSLYYSICDWYQPDWTPWRSGGPGYELPPGEEPDLDRYVTYMKNQIQELLTNYGHINLLWYDGTDPRNDVAPYWTCERGADLEAYTRALQPGIVMNTRVGCWDGPWIPWDNGHWWTKEYGDYDSSEVGMGAFNMDSPWEYTFTLGTQWSWKPNDSYKSLKSIVQYLVNIVGRDGNLLLDTSPPSSGKFEQNVVDRLLEIGHWLKHYGESIYAVRGGPYKPGSWGVSTRKDNRIYVHVLNWSQNTLVLPAIDKTIINSWVLTGGETSVTQTLNDVTIGVPEYYRRDIDTIVVLELDGPAMDIDPIDTF